MAEVGTPQTSRTTAAEILDASAPPTSSTPTSQSEASKPLPDSAEPGAKPGQTQDERVSPKFSALIQRERSAVERERAAKAKEAEIAAREQAFAEREAKIQEFESLKKTNPLKALQLLGLTYQELTEIQLADGNITPEIQTKRLEEKLNSIEKAREDEKRQEAEAAQAAEARKNEETITAFKGQISKHLETNKERYELIAFEGQQELVYDLIDEHFERTKQAHAAKLEEEGKDPSEAIGEVLPIAQAADKVEEHLEKKYDKARSLSKVKVLLAPKPEKTSAKPTLPTSSQKPQTLTNTLSATPAGTRKAPITDDERVARAIAYARGLRP